MRRIVMAAAVLTAGLLGIPTPANADYVDGMCTITHLDGPADPSFRVLVTAHPASPDPTQPETTTKCSLHRGDEFVGGFETTVPGPTGFFGETWRITTVPANKTWYICTEVWTTPTTVVPPEYCDVAFWW